MHEAGGLRRRDDPTPVRAHGDAFRLSADADVRREAMGRDVDRGDLRVRLVRDMLRSLGAPKMLEAA